MTQKLDTADLPQRRCPMPLDDAVKLIDAAPFAVLSTVDEAGNPYGVPVSVARDPKSNADALILYFHSTPFEKSRKTLNMLSNPRVSLVFVGSANTLGDRYTVDYESVVVAGRVEKLEASSEIQDAIDVLCARFAPTKTAEENAAYVEASKNYLPIFWRVKVDRVTGKRHVNN